MIHNQTDDGGFPVYHCPLHSLSTTDVHDQVKLFNNIMVDDSIDIDLVKPLTAQAKTPRQQDSSPLRAHGFVQWLLAHYFPSKVRKSALPIEITTPKRGHLRIQVTQCSEDEIMHSDEIFDGPKWEKGVSQALKKIVVDDLGLMDAKELEASIPLKDSEGRGMSDLHALEKKLSVKVVFDDITGHVLLVGDGKKMEKKVFVIRNMLSHYHWRLSGSDVAFKKATSARL